MPSLRRAISLAFALTLSSSTTPSAFTVSRSQANSAIDVTWERTAGFPVGGVYWAIALDATDPSLLYVGVENLGVLWSKDSGNTWQRIDPGHHFIRGIRLDPLDKTIAYYAYGGGLAVIEVQTGRTLRTVALGGSSGYSLENRISAIEIDRSGTVYVSSPAGIFKTTDKGRTVVRIGTGLPSGTIYSALAIEPTDPNTIYAGTRGPWKYDSLFVDRPPQGYTGKGIYKSTDGGSTWNPRNTGLSNLNVNRILSHPSVPAMLYAATVEGVYRSTDSGASWTAMNVGLSHLDVWTLEMDPRDPSRMFAGTWGGGLYVSMNGGSTWQRTRLSGIDVHRDHIFSLTFDPNDPRTLYVGTGYGLFKYDVLDGSFPNVEGTLFKSSTSFIAVSPTDPSVLYALEGGVGGGRDLYRSFNAGASWEFIGPHKGLEPTRSPTGYSIDHTYGMEVAIHPRNTDIVYYSSGFGGLYKSLNRGDTWRRVSLAPGMDTSHVHGLASFAKDPNIMYAGTGGNVRPDVIFLHMMKSLDGGETWTLIDSGMPPDKNAHVFDVVVHPDNPDIAYMATTKTGFGCHPHPASPECEPLGIYKTLDGGRRWFAVNEGLEDLDVLTLAFHPENSEVIYTGAGNAVYKSENAGPWRKLVSFGTSKVTAVALDPNSPGVILASTYGSGIHASVNGGETWMPVNNGLDNLSVDHLVIDPRGGTVYAAARGVYKGRFSLRH